MIKYKYISQNKYTEAILSNSTRKLLRFVFTKMLIVVFLEHNSVVLFIIIFGTLSFPVVLCLLLAASLGENYVLVGSFAAVSRACDAVITGIRVLFGFLV